MTDIVDDIALLLHPPLPCEPVDNPDDEFAGLGLVEDQRRNEQIKETREE